MGIATSCVQNETQFHPPRSLTALTKTYSSSIFSLSISDSIIIHQVASVRNQGVILILPFLPSPNYIYFICKFFDFPFRMYPQSVFSPLSPEGPTFCPGPHYLRPGVSSSLLTMLPASSLAIAQSILHTEAGEKIIPLLVPFNSLHG